MNDLTREELEDIYEWGNVYCTDMPTISKIHHGNLLGKIQSMIDSFEDFPHQHEWRARNPIIQVEGYNGQVHDFNPVIIHCKTCGESYFS